MLLLLEGGFIRNRRRCEGWEHLRSSRERTGNPMRRIIGAVRGMRNMGKA